MIMVDLETAEEFAQELRRGINTAYTSWPADLLLMACAEIRELRQKVEELTRNIKSDE